MRLRSLDCHANPKESRVSLKMRSIFDFSRSQFTMELPEGEDDRRRGLEMPGMNALGKMNFIQRKSEKRHELAKWRNAVRPRFNE
jgi:hypothetical protein